MAIGGRSSFPFQQASGNPSSDLNSSENQAAELEMSIPNVDRIMRSVLPRYVQIEEDSKALMAKFASQFMSDMIEEANRQCLQEGRTIVTGEDLTVVMRRVEIERQAEAYVYHARLRQQYNIANGARAVVTRQDPRNNVPVPMAPSTPPPPHVDADHRAPMVGALSGDEEGSSDGHESGDEMTNGSFSG